MSALHIGKLIRHHLDELGMSKSEFARRIGTSPQNLYGIFKRKSCDTELLREISRVLNYDFFSFYTEKSLIGEKDADGKMIVLSAAQLKRDLDAKTREVEILKNENEYLKEIHRLMKDKISAKVK
ncbi:MAG TPA: helix-turn-helix transcriptional regulator [Bacteroidia bacterium]|jgi:predicted transcriptional regulator|nr:helix-turn-helix transcriptional regulator [Bacteroidia bacterium]